jgi:hypothetical protein
MSLENPTNVSKEEIESAESNMHRYEKVLSTEREGFTEGVDMELVKKCQLRFRRDNRNEGIFGTIDGVEIVMERSVSEPHEYSVLIGGEYLTEDGMSKDLWEKYFPIVRLIGHSEELDTEAEKRKLLASKLLSL